MRCSLNHLSRGFQLIKCSPNLPSVYIRLCKHGNHFTFFYKITNERGTKTVFISSCKMVLWPIRARVLFELFYNLPLLICILTAGRLLLGNHAEQIEAVSAPVKPRCDGSLNSPHHLHLRDIVDLFQNSYFKM